MVYAIAPIPALQLDAVHVLSGTTIRMLRRMVRDYLNRGRPVLNTLRQWPAVAAGEVNNIYPHQSNADAMMNSEIAYEMCLLKVHAEPLLKTIRPTEREYSEVAVVVAAKSAAALLSLIRCCPIVVSCGCCCYCRYCC